MPQTVLLEALHEKAKLFPNFELWFDARAEDTIEENGKCTGVTVTRGGEKMEVQAKVTVGADGRFSVIRKRGGFELADEDHKFDLIWFTLEKPADYNDKVQFHLSDACNYLILPKYPKHIQCGLVVEKGGYAKYAKQGIDSLRRILLNSNPMFHAFAESLKDFSPFSVLQAKIEFVKEWAKDGVVLVGDSAHTCSPAGAVGVSVATATAIVAAEVIGSCFKKNDFSKTALGEIQKLREREVLHIQSRQKAFSGLLFTRTSGRRREIFLFTASLIARSGLLKEVQRDLFVMKEPLPVSSQIYF